MKFRELSLKFRKNERPEVKYSSINSDEAEVVAFDSSLSKRVNTNAFETEENTDDPNDDMEVPLVAKKNNLSNSLSESGNGTPLASRKHKDD